MVKLYIFSLLLRLRPDYFNVTSAIFVPKLPHDPIVHIILLNTDRSPTQSHPATQFLGLILFSFTIIFITVLAASDSLRLLLKYTINLYKHYHLLYSHFVLFFCRPTLQIILQCWSNSTLVELIP